MAADKHRELVLKAQVMGTMDALVATTKVNAELLRLEDKIGTVEAGKLADLIVVDGDPVTDISVFRREDALRVIMQDGRFITNEA
jgi:imidazolonepropionase-like amidohydrolase